MVLQSTKWLVRARICWLRQRQGTAVSTVGLRDGRCALGFVIDANGRGMLFYKSKSIGSAVYEMVGARLASLLTPTAGDCRSTVGLRNGWCALEFVGYANGRGLLFYSLLFCGWFG